MVVLLHSILQENNWLGRGVKISANVDMSKETFTGGLNVTDPNYQFSGNSINYFAENTTNDKATSGL